MATTIVAPGNVLQTTYLRRRLQAALSSGMSVVAASAVLVAVASTLIWFMRIDDTAEHLAAVDAIVMVQRLHAVWNVELARTRSAPQSNFDALAEFSHQTIQLKSRIAAAIRRISDLTPSVRDHARNLVHALEAKQNSTENYKRHYAVVRNAARYLPLATSALAKDPNVNSNLLRGLLAVQAMLGRLVADPASVETGEVAEAMADLKIHSTNLADATANGIATFVSHAALYAEHQTLMDNAYVQAMSGNVANLSAALVRELRNMTADREDRVELYLYALVTVGLVLLWLWCAATLSIFRRANTRKIIDEVDGSVSNASSEIFPVSCTLLAEIVAKRIAEKAQEVSKCADSLIAVRSYARSEFIRKAKLMADIGIYAKEIGNVAEHLGRFATARDDTSSHYDWFDIRECIERAILVTGAESVAAVKVDHLSDAPPLLALRTDICAILANVLANAVQAVQDAKRNGEISISTVWADDGIAVRVVDNGVGMTPATLERAEQPFYSTSATGPGMGLAVTSYLVAKYHGSMSVSSKPDSGTTVRIVLQIVDPDFLKAQARHSILFSHANGGLPE